MISEIRIQNFKSIRDLTLKPGRVTVLIGENGSGKSNILEGIAFAAGAAANKLDNEFLYNRGIRVTEETWMRSAFPQTEPESSAYYPSPPANADSDIKLSVKGGDGEPAYECTVSSILNSLDESFAGWSVQGGNLSQAELREALLDQDFSMEVEKDLEALKDLVPKYPTPGAETDSSTARSLELLKVLIASGRLGRSKQNDLREKAAKLGLMDFVIYAPENTVLRTPPFEGAISPLGTKGEGLIRLLQLFTDPNISDPILLGRYDELNELLHLFGWFDGLPPLDESAALQAQIPIRDRWLAKDRNVFNQRSANEGFLYVLFYLTLLLSWRTPAFFAIDNADSSLNPKLCSALMREIARLGKKYNKQVICTTHNPALLDGLNINDDDQRLYTVQRNEYGHTVVNRVQPPKPPPGKPPVKLSAAFVAGYIGGLPDHF